jgi:chromosome segregation ATPase
MIYNSITGGSDTGASQLLDLLKLVANPKEYEAKLKSLEEAEERNQKLVEAVGPASEIPVLLEKAKADKAAAASELAAAKAEASKVKADAKKQAAASIEAAEKAAKASRDEAASILEQAKAKIELVEKMKADVAADSDRAASLQKDLNDKIAKLVSDQKDLDSAKKEVNELRQALRKKLEDIAKAADL